MVLASSVSSVSFFDRVGTSASLEGEEDMGWSRTPVARMMLPSMRERTRTAATSGRVERWVNAEGRVVVEF